MALKFVGTPFASLDWRELTHECTSLSVLIAESDLYEQQSESIAMSNGGMQFEEERLFFLQRLGLLPAGI